MPKCYATLMKKCWDKDPAKRPTALYIKEKLISWQSVLGWFPTPESRKDDEAKQFEEADDEKNKANKRYDGKIYTKSEVESHDTLDTSKTRSDSQRPSSSQSPAPIITLSEGKYIESIHFVHSRIILILTLFVLAEGHEILDIVRNISTD